VWDTTLVPNGTYFVRIVASDSPSNPASVALSGERDSTAFQVDHTPPAIVVGSTRTEGGRTTLVFDVTDADSPVSRVEYSRDGGVRWTAVCPKDGIADSKSERYEVTIEGEISDAGLTIRASDSMNNTDTTHVAPPRPADATLRLLVAAQRRVFPRTVVCATSQTMLTNGRPLARRGFESGARDGVAALPPSHPSCRRAGRGVVAVENLEVGDRALASRWPTASPASLADRVPPPRLQRPAAVAARKRRVERPRIITRASTTKGSRLSPASREVQDAGCESALVRSWRTASCRGSTSGIVTASDAPTRVDHPTSRGRRASTRRRRRRARPSRG
jgi:hypothetical protein